MRSNLAAVVILFAMLSNAAAFLAFETDQFNLPPVPLADIGPEVDEYVVLNIKNAIAKLNSEIIESQQCLDRAGENRSKCRTDAWTRKRLAYLRSDAAAARAVYYRLGWGIIAFARAGDWMNSHDFRAQPARYKTSFGDSIFVTIPTDYLTISPTVNVHDTSLGTDKIAHIFQQGYTYYTIFQRSMAKGSTVEAALKKAIGWGRMTENTYYGTLVGGVYSNADMAANYAGLEFYRGLTGPIEVGDATIPALLTRENGIWVINDRTASILKPFISDHLNEALNPSIYIPGLRSSIRGVVRKKSCLGWRISYPGKTRDAFDAETEALKLWNGKSYGFKTSRSFVTIGNTCFDEKAGL
jgi:hypothetical protein